MGRATSNSQRYKALGNISIHALRGEGDKNVAESIKKYGYFNPRPPWGGRRKCRRLELSHRHFNPRPPWGGRRTFALNNSINAEFQSTPSVGRATISRCCSAISKRISIHALRGEGDLKITLGKKTKRHFNPRPPWGGRPSRGLYSYVVPADFNPRPPWGGRPQAVAIGSVSKGFQSTPSVGRATDFDVAGTHVHLYFNPRPPWGGRQQKHTNMQHCVCT